MNFVSQILKNSYFSVLILFFCNLAINANEITPKRIMSLSPSITEILFEIGSENQVIAVDSLSNFPIEAPRTKISAYEPNVETISLYKPDLVILSFNIRNLKEALSKLGVDTIYLPAPNNFEQILDQIDLLGKRTGNTEKAQELILNMQNKMKAFVSLRKNKNPIKVYHEIDQNYYSPSKFSFIGDIYQKLNFKNIADSADISGLGYPKLSPELIISENPELIILPGKNEKYSELLKSRSGWNYINAVKENNIILLQKDIASRWGPRILDFVNILAEYSNN